jgi:hypothetical protein
MRYSSTFKRVQHPEHDYHYTQNDNEFTLAREVPWRSLKLDRELGPQCILTISVSLSKFPVFKREYPPEKNIEILVVASRTDARRRDQTDRTTNPSSSKQEAAQMPRKDDLTLVFSSPACGGKTVLHGGHCLYSHDRDCSPSSPSLHHDSIYEIVLSDD